MRTAEEWASTCDGIGDHGEQAWFDPTDAIRAAQDEAWNEAIEAAAMQMECGCTPEQRAGTCWRDGCGKNDANVIRSLKRKEPAA